jgi:kynurenine formamidase
MVEPGRSSEPAYHTITPQARLAAFDLITRGHIYDLGIALCSKSPRPSAENCVPFRLFTHRTPEDIARDGDNASMTFHIDGVEGTLHQSTHVDALVHCQHEGKIYGGADMTKARRDRGWTEHGVETIPPIVARGVVFDLLAVKDTDHLPDGYAVTADDLAQCLGAHGMTLEPGDVPLIRTGKIRDYLDNLPAATPGAPGLSARAARYLVDSGAAAIAIDGPSVDPEPVPDRGDTAHVALLVERGAPVIENVMLEELAARRIVECVFVAVPLKITGASGSWIRPIAIV